MAYKKVILANDNISELNNDSGFTTNTGTTTASNSQTFTNKSGNISQWTNNSGYLTSGSSAVTGKAPKASPTFSGTATFSGDTSGISYSDLEDTPTVPTNNNQLTNGAGYTTNTGTITGISTSTGLDGGTTSGSTTISLDLSELTDMTAAINKDQDELILLDNGAERRKRFSEIFGSNAYNSTTIPTNNNQLTNGAGYTTNTGTTTASNSQTFTNKSGNISQWTNDSGYVTSSGVTSMAVSAGKGLDGGGTITSSGTVTLTLDLSEVDDMTASVNTLQDEIILLDNGVQRRKLFSEIFGSNAYNSTTIPTNNNQLTNGAGYTTNTGTTTASNSQTFTNKSGNISQWTNNSGYVTSSGVTSLTISTGTGLDGGGTYTSTGTASITLDLSELTDMTANIDPDVDELILLDNGAERRKRFREIFGTNAYNSTTIPTNNNQLTNGAGYTTNTGTTTASNSQTFTNKSGNISQWTNDAGYLTSAGTMSSWTLAAGSTTSVSNGEAVTIQGSGATTVSQSGRTVTISSTGTTTASNSQTFTNKSGNISQWTNNSGYLTSINNGNWSGTDLAVANGGTGSSSASGARSNLGAAEATVWTSNQMLSARGTAAPDTSGDNNGLSVHYSQTNAVNRPSGTDHSLLTMSYSSAWQNQIAQDWREDGRIYIRGQENGTWSSWHKVFSEYETVPIANGGTGSTSASGARTSLGLGSLATASSISNGNWSGTDLAVANGGTGASNASGARSNLGLGSLATASSISNGNWSGTDLAVNNGGTGSSTASGAATNLGLGTGSDVRFDSFGVGTNASGTTGEIRATNDVTAYYSSDKRLKKKLKLIQNPLDLVDKISGYTFEWKKSRPKNVHSHSGADIGVIAQEIEALELPGLVETRDNGYKAVNYEKVVPVLIEAIKELNKKLEFLGEAWDMVDDGYK